MWFELANLIHQDTQNKFSELKYVTNTCILLINLDTRPEISSSDLLKNLALQASEWFHPVFYHHCSGVILNLYHNHFPLPLHPLYPPHRSSSTDWCTGSLNTNACCVHLTHACMWSRWLQQREVFTPSVFTIH